jgi:hypothetical protein
LRTVPSGTGSPPKSIPTDESTTRLMEEFYPLLPDHEDKATALRSAKRGLSVYRIITEYPARFLSLTVLPGVPPDERAFNRLGGGEDPEWVRASQETKQKLDDLGIENTIEVVARASHLVPIDPVKLFDLLDRCRPKNADCNAR